MRGLRAFLRQSFVMEFARGFGIAAEIELIFPAKFELGSVEHPANEHTIDRVIGDAAENRIRDADQQTVPLFRRYPSRSTIGLDHEGTCTNRAHHGLVRGS